MTATPHDDRTSTTLLARVRDLDDSDAWRRFLGEYRPFIVAWCRRQRLHDDDVEEVASSVLEKLARHLPEFQYDRTRSFRAWLKTVVGRAIIDHQRRQSAPGAVGSGDTARLERLEQLAADSESSANDLSQLLGDKLERDVHLARDASDRVRERVSPTTWQAFWLTAVENRPGPEVAAQLGIKVANVYVHKNRVIKLLREELAPTAKSPGSEP